MNSRERVLTTLRHEQADRVPIAEMWIDPRVVRAIVPEARESSALVEYLGLGMELDRILDRYPRRITVMGNLSVDLLGRGTVEELAAATERLLRGVSAKGPHNVSSGNTIASCVRPEGFLALARTTQAFGRNPIPVTSERQGARPRCFGPSVRPGTGG